MLDFGCPTFPPQVRGFRETVWGHRGLIFPFAENRRLLNKTFKTAGDGPFAFFN